eukprot:TRINITY_DN3954_c0_g1_i2.p1 TRINITY_DN3954_c0_g1~~TRINITY_DN3954_c0_g1_i2.p1  ORF type:complete len:609 (-),score=71.40 TRINITY_DN3954_c0_g1_i2:45-1871(-)
MVEQAEQSGVLEGVRKDLLVDLLAVLVDKVGVSQNLEDDRHTSLRGLVELSLQIKMKTPGGCKSGSYLDLVLAQPRPKPGRPPVPDADFVGEFSTSSCGEPRPIWGMCPVHDYSPPALPYTDIAGQICAWLLVVVVLVNALRCLRRMYATGRRAFGSKARCCPSLWTLLGLRHVGGDQAAVHLEHLSRLRIRRALDMANYFGLLVAGMAGVQVWRFFFNSPQHDEQENGRSFLLDLAAPTLLVCLLLVLAMLALGDRMRVRYLDVFNALLALCYSLQFSFMWPHAGPNLSSLLSSLQLYQSIMFGNPLWSSVLIIGCAISHAFAILNFGAPRNTDPDLAGLVLQAIVTIVIIVFWDKAMHVEVLRTLETRAERHLLSRFMTASFDANIEFELSASGGWIVSSADEKAKAFFMQQDMIGLSLEEFTSSGAPLRDLLNASMTSSDGPALMSTMCLKIGNRELKGEEQSCEMKVSACCGPANKVSLWFATEDLNPHEVYASPTANMEADLTHGRRKGIPITLYGGSGTRSTVPEDSNSLRECGFSAITEKDMDNATMVSFHSQLVDESVGGQITRPYDQMISSRFAGSLTAALSHMAPEGPSCKGRGAFSL